MSTNDSLSLSSRVEYFRGEIEKALCESLNIGDNCPLRLVEAMRYSLLSSGKRLRPLFVLLAAGLCKGDYRQAIPAACAVEMIHAYSLVHDDLPAMDNDDLRRGRLTCHKQFDEATAILVGDALIPLAFEMFGELSSMELAGRCSIELAKAAGAAALVGGQMDDVIHEKSLDDKPETASIDLLKKIHLRKTGALVRVSLRLGGIIAGGSEKQIDALDEYGKNFGLAFQITDDLLDAIGDENKVGKRVRKDNKMDKWTYPSLLGISNSQLEAERHVEDAINALNIFDENLDKEILIKSAQNLIGREK
ncbi:MAG: polyprenyl synthetase family protein [Planctomycetaceae bacterium]|jgi:geranylgeranyl diphosphate synthase type II|nr:polyprenyl synthetase family protein [Planctomycetaceae bacterium]